jgi:hypothetical protein
VQLLDVKTMNPSDLLNRIRASIPGLSWGYLSNSLIRALLYRDKKENFVVSTGQCCGSGIRCFLPSGSGIRDGAMVGSGSGIRDKQTKFVIAFIKQEVESGIRCFFTPPGSGMEQWSGPDPG